MQLRPSKLIQKWSNRSGGAICRTVQFRSTACTAGFHFIGRSQPKSSTMQPSAGLRGRARFWDEARGDPRVAWKRGNLEQVCIPPHLVTKTFPLGWASALCQGCPRGARARDPRVSVARPRGGGGWGGPRPHPRGPARNSPPGARTPELQPLSDQHGQNTPLRRGGPQVPEYQFVTPFSKNAPKWCIAPFGHQAPKKWFAI